MTSSLPSLLRSLAHRRRCRRHLHRHGAARRRGRRAHLQVAVRAGRSQRGRLGRAAAGRPAARPAAFRPAARLRAVRARLDRGHQHHPREEGRQGRPAHHRGLSRFAGDPPRHPREPVGPPRAVPRGAGAALPAPAGARTHRRRRPRAGAAGRRGRRRGGQGVRRGRRRIRRRLPVQFLPRRQPRARGRRAARQELGGPMDLAVERGHADHGRVRAQLDRRGQRLHRAQGDELPRRARPAAAPARPAALAAAAAEQRRRGVGRPGREPPRHAGAVRPGRRRRRAERLRGAGRGAPT